MRMSNQKTRMARRAAEKLRGHGGLTLVELMITVVLVAIIGGIVTVSITLALNHFRARTQDSDAQLLCSALALFVEDELTYASNIQAKVAEDGSGRNEIDSFTDHARDLGSKCRFLVDDTTGHLVLSYGGIDTNIYEPVGAGAYGGSVTVPPEVEGGAPGTKVVSGNKSLTAGITTDCLADGKVRVTISVFEYPKAADASPLTTTEFTVKPISP